ncbi:solute carrier family 12 member 9-like isoform X2 [Dysidea avara]
MISRALGPEFGGSIGVIFFTANVFASATYIIGFTEALVNNFGDSTGTLIHHDSIIYGERWWQFLYGSIVLLLCLLVCLIGASLFARTTFLIFVCVMVALASVYVSFGAKEGPFNVQLPADNDCLNKSDSSTVNITYTAWSFQTLQENLWGHYTVDYTNNCNDKMSFATVFAILFNGCTGITAGANISGDLKNPSVAIPTGTLLACAITFVIYVLLFSFAASTCSRSLLVNNYNFLQLINLRKEFITIGVFAATLSAALSTLIGASRILQALAKDRLFGGILHIFTKTVGKNKEPLFSVLLSWLFVQCILLIGSLNTIAPLVTMFFLLSYGVVNLACFALKLASAPNFRPTFHMYSRTTAAVGTLGCVVLMFFIDPLYAAIAISLMVVIFVYLLFRGPATPWGDVSQGLIYYQVRKFLLRLDVRKDHVKFWRPQILLLVANPKSSYPLIDFTNDLKKGGLYILGHVIVKPFDLEATEMHHRQLPIWLNLVDVAKVKAFVELTIASTVRQGAQSLLTTTGLGGMKPNTLAMGFYCNTLPVSNLDRCYASMMKTPKMWRYIFRTGDLEKFQLVSNGLPELRNSADSQPLRPEEYVHIIKDAMVMGKNVCIMRHFENFDKAASLQDHPYIDVWPIKSKPGDSVRDNTFMLVLQLATILHMVPEWKSHTKLRIFTIVETNADKERKYFDDMLKELRIQANFEMVSPLGGDSLTGYGTVGSQPESPPQGSLPFYIGIHDFMKQYSSNASVIFTSLPPAPDDQSSYLDYLQCLDQFTADLPPVVMAFGTMPVMTISL